jgi:hypothetical protein
MKKLLELLCLSFFISPLICAQEFPVIRSSPQIVSPVEVDLSYRISCPNKSYVLSYQEKSKQLSLTTNVDNSSKILDLSQSELMTLFSDMRYLGHLKFYCGGQYFVMDLLGSKLNENEMTPLHYKISVSKTGEVAIYKHDYTLKQLNKALGIKKLISTK